MALETGSYISALVATNPTASDPKSQGDDHLRFVKAKILETFPSVTGAVTPTHTELNYVDGVTSAIQTQIDAKAPSTVLQAGTGAVARTVQAKTRDIVSVKDFGAVGDGVADDTAEIQAAVDSGATAIYFPNGIYNLSSPILIETGILKVYGDGPYSIVQTTSDIDLFRLKIDAYISSVEVTGLRLRYVGAGSQASGSGVRLYDSTGVGTGGAGGIRINNIIFNGLYHCIVVDNPEKVLWGGVLQIGNYYSLHFTDLYCPDGAKTQAFGILFKGVPGNHHTISGCILSNDTANIRIGDGGADSGLGDQVIYGNHLLNAQYGIDLIGPTGASRYNENVNIICNHFDGTTVNTVRMSNMSNFRSWLNNSTASVGVSLTTCTNYALEDRNTFGLPNLTVTASSATPALKVTQTGTGNAFVVEDSASTDSTPFVIDGNGSAIFGHTSQVAGSVYNPTRQFLGTDSGAGIGVFEYSADTNRPIIQLNKSRGATVNSQTVVANNDTVGQIQFAGSDGTGFIRAALVEALVDGTPGTNDMPGRLVFSTTADGASSPTERLRIDNAGVITARIGTAIPAGGTAGFGYCATSTANFGVFFGSGAPTLSAAKGSLYLRSDGSTTNDRMYVNTNGTTTWTAVVTAA